MANGSATCSPFRISTDAYPESGRLAAWREIYGRNIVHFDVEPLNDSPFQAEVKIFPLPGVAIASGTRSDSRYVGSKKSIAKAQGQILLSMTTRGESLVEQRGRQVLCRPGDAVLLSGSEVGTTALRGGGAFKTLAFPRASLQALVPDIDDALARPISAHNEALRLLTVYLGGLGDGPMSAAVAATFANHLLDLTALALGARGDAREMAKAGGARAAIRRAILEAIKLRASDPRISASSVAGKLGISERHLRQILEETGRSFTELVLQRRLQLAWTQLADPRQSGRSIGEIAYSAGFSDISYFNRSFRRFFGETPTGARAALLLGRK